MKPTDLVEGTRALAIKRILAIAFKPVCHTPEKINSKIKPKTA